MAFLRTLSSKPTKTLCTVFRSLLSPNLNNPKTTHHFSSNSPQPEPPLTPLPDLVNELSRVLSDHRNPQDDLELSLSNFSAAQISTDIVEQVLKRCKYLSFSAHRFFLWAKRIRGFEPSPDSFRILIDVLGQGKQFAILWDLLIEARDSGSFELGSDIFRVVFRAYSRANLPRDAIRAFNRMPEFRVAPNSDDLDQLLYTLCKRRHVRHAHEFFEKVKVDFRPTAKTYSILIRGWADTGDSENARQLFDEMRNREIPADLPSYNGYIQALSRGGLASEAYEVFRAMPVGPDAATYAIFVRAYCEANDTRSALRVLDAAKRRNLVANTYTYNRVIDGLSKNDGIDEAYKILDEMAQNDVSKPDSWTYNAILSFHCDRCEVNRALKLLSRMEKNDSTVKPDRKSYNMVLKMLIRIGRFDRVSEIWDRINNNNNNSKGCFFNPSVSTYSVMIHGMLKKRGKIEEACGYFGEMVDGGIPPYSSTVDMVRKRLVGLGLVDEIEVLARKMDRSSCCSIKEMACVMRGQNRDFVVKTLRREEEEEDTDIESD